MEWTKAAIREAMRARRRALRPVDLASAETAVAARVLQLPAWGACAALIAYVPTDHEVPTGALLDAAHAAGKRLFLPRLDGDRMISPAHPLGAALRPGAFGIPQPTGDSCTARDLAESLAVLPLLAWDDAGGRVGRGGGHYDRACAGARRPRWLVGLGYAFQQVPRVPADPWDLRLDGVVTEDQAVTCWTGDDASPLRKEVEPHHEQQSTVDSRQPGAGGRPGLPAGRFSAPAS
ncbi:MAG: 5-formyltetrahydrofolate cyclo-ligase [Deltaproteobacteria bacterium]|nr:5-formyltetrahydrofolate cyclo-ligase [Deltaproteobacteria bacterium]